MSTSDSATLQRHLDTMTGLRQRGLSVLQPFWFGKTGEDHIDTLLRLAEFPDGARILDIGCGVGGCAELMYKRRPDLKFVLLNFSETQLNECPDGFEKRLADAHALPFENGSFDAVMFHAAIGNMEFCRAFLEATRVLKTGGIMLVNEIERVSGDNDLMRKVLMYSAVPDSEMQRIAESANLSVVKYNPPVQREFLKEIWSEGVGYDEVVAGTRAAVWRLVKNAGINLDYIGRFKKPALQFSGGKDSLALLHLFGPVLDRITVYNLDTGDGCPETRAVIEDAKKWVPHFETIQSDVSAWKAANGWPSDLVPARAHEIGLLYGMNSFKLSNRFDCCCANLMAPMQARMQADGVDLIIRGTKHADTGRVPHEGPAGWCHTWLPIREWSHDDVFSYLKQVGAMHNPIYDHFRSISAPECLHCTAWWDDGKSRYLKARHPEVYNEYIHNLKLIAGVVTGHISDLTQELQ